MSRRFLDSLAVRTLLIATLAVLLGATVAVLLDRWTPRGPKSERGAIEVARRYAKIAKPGYLYDNYEAGARSEDGGRNWVVSFVKNRPAIHTLIYVYDDGSCRVVPIHYYPEGYRRESSIAPDVR